MRFKDKFITLLSDEKVIALGIKQQNDIWRMFFRVTKSHNIEEANMTTTDLRMWHERLGHVDKHVIRELIRKGLVTGVSMMDKSGFTCEMCHLGKAHRLPFQNRNTVVSNKPGEVIHTDVCGPMSVESIGGSRYYLLFKDVATNYRHVYFLKYKHNMYEKFKEFKKLVTNKFEQSIKVLRSDNGLEFCNRKINDYLAAHGIKKENTAPYTPE